MSFKEKWLAAVEQNNSVLCAGLDPAEFAMGRGKKGLPERVDKKSWSLAYVEAVAPYSAALKPNVQYWKDADDMAALAEIVELSHRLGLVVIDDSKLADIGTTNDAGMYHSANKGFDAVTIAPYAGNMDEATIQGQTRGLGVITMVLMSNAEYAQEKNMLVSLDDMFKTYDQRDLVLRTGDQFFTKRFIHLAWQAGRNDLDGIVIGAPSPNNHINGEEIAAVRRYTGKQLVLLPGVGDQGGEAEAIWRHYNLDAVIVNVGRELMFPQGSSSTREDHQAAAKQYQEMLNALRGV